MKAVDWKYAYNKCYEFLDKGRVANPDEGTQVCLSLVSNVKSMTPGIQVVHVVLGFMCEECDEASGAIPALLLESLAGSHPEQLRNKLDETADARIAVSKLWETVAIFDVQVTKNFMELSCSMSSLDDFGDSKVEFPSGAAATILASCVLWFVERRREMQWNGVSEAEIEDFNNIYGSYVRDLATGLDVEDIDGIISSVEETCRLSRMSN